MCLFRVVFCVWFGFVLCLCFPTCASVNLGVRIFFGCFVCASINLGVRVYFVGFCLCDVDIVEYS